MGVHIFPAELTRQYKVMQSEKDAHIHYLEAEVSRLRETLSQSPPLSLFHFIGTEVIRTCIYIYTCTCIYTCTYTYNTSICMYIYIRTLL